MNPVHAVGNWQGLAGRRHTILGIAAAIGQGADPVTDDELVDPCADRDHFSRHFQARNRAHSRLHRVLAGALNDVGTVDPGGVNADQHFAGGRHRQRFPTRLQDLGAARLGDFNEGHGLWQGMAVACF